MSDRKGDKRMVVQCVWFFSSIGSRREVKARGNDSQRLTALEQLKRARQGGQGAIVEQVHWLFCPI